MKDKLIYPYILVVISMALWGMTFVWTNIVLEVYEPVTLITFRLFLSTVILGLFIFIFRQNQKISKKDLPLFALSALFSPFIYFIGETYGLKFVSPTIGAVMITTIPVVTPIGTRIFLNERLSWVNLLGFVVSFSGVLLIIFSGAIEKGATIKGILFLILAVFAAVGYAITVKKLSAKYNSPMVVVMQNGIGTLLFIPIFFIFEFNEVMTIQPSTRVLTSIVYLAVFGSTLAFLFFTSSIRMLGVNKATVFSNLIPVFTAIFSYFILSEVFNVQKVMGMVIVIAGVLFVQLKVKGKMKGVYRFFYRKK